MWDGWFGTLRGRVLVKLEGPFCERFFNLCMKKNISLWNVCRREESFYCHMTPRAFRLLRPIARKTGTKVHILEKSGLPFLLKKYRARHFFIPGILLFALLLGELSSFVWFIEPMGLEKIPEEEVLELLSDAGLSPGTKKRKIDPGEIQRKVLLATDDIVWLWADVRGVKAYVSVKESTPIPEMLPSDSPANLVAAYDGVIEKITVRGGQPMVEEGATVAKGDLLVSGVVESSLGTYRLVHAHGEVRARTWQEASRECSLTSEIRTPTGRTKKGWRIKILNFSINLFGNSRNIYENYDKITSIKKVTLFGASLPVTIYTSEWQEMDVKKELKEGKEVQEKMAAVLKKEMSPDLKDAEILEETVLSEPISENRIKVTLRIEAEREIAESVPIGEENFYGNGTHRSAQQ